MKKILGALLLVAATTLSIGAPTASAQLPEVKSVQTYDSIIVSAVAISPDGSFVVATCGDGLAKIDLDNGRLTVVSHGAAYGVRISEDNRYAVFYRPVYKDKFRYVSLMSVDLSDGKERILVAPTRHLGAGFTIAGNSVNVVADDSIRVIALDGGTPQPAPAVFIDYGRLKYSDGNKVVTLDPYGRASYLWPAVSPDGKRIAFRLAGYGTYTCLTDGSDLRLVGDYMMTVWAGDNCVVGVDERETTAQVLYKATLVAVDVITGQTVALTDKDIRATGPSASRDGRRIAFHTTDGRLGLVSLLFPTTSTDH